MKKLILVAALAASFCGCQTRITAEKHPETVVPIQRVVTVNGAEQVITTDAVRASGGWYATARSPLWAAEAIRGLEIGVETNGAVRMAVADYSRDLSTNAVEMAHNLVTDFALLAEKVGAAYASCGGSVVAGGAASALKKAIANYIAKGGKAENATVTCADGACTISDGSVTESATYGGVP